MRRLASFLVAAAGCCSTQAYAQDPTTEIDKLFNWATTETPGCVVGVSHHGKVVMDRAYGMADLERRVPMSSSSVFDIGSVQKQFVAAAVLLLAQDGRLSLSDAVRKHIPELPDYGHTITLDHLLTHTSGIRDWTGILPLAGPDTDVLQLILRQRGLNFVPGEEWSYSNSGYVLLKEIVARASGMSFAEFARKRLFEPLGMKSTAYVPDAKHGGDNVALAYEKRGTGWKQDMMLGDARGGGALLSTAGDLLLWNDGLTSGKLGKFVTSKLEEPVTLNNGRKLGYARALFLDSNRGGRVVWHTGSAAAYKTMLARYPEQGLSTAIVCNAGDASARGDATRRIFDLFVPNTAVASARPSSPPAAVADVRVSEVEVKSRAGLYFSEGSSEPLQLAVDNGRLRIVGGPALVAVASDRFRNPRGTLGFMSGDEFELHFVSPDQLELKSKEGRTARYRRAQPFAPTAEEVRAYEGRYTSDDIGTVFEVLPGKDGLVLRFESSPERAVEFRPVDRDTFQRSRVFVRFRRDESGRVVGFDYTNPVVRRITFTRLADMR